MKKWITRLAISALALSASTLSFAEDATLKAVDSKMAAQIYQPQGNTVDGNPKGSVTLVEFFDYNCTFCRGLAPTIQKLIKQNPDLRVVYKEFSLNAENSEPGISGALAAQKQGKYLEMHKALLGANMPLETTQQVLTIGKTLGLNTKQLEADMNSPETRKAIDKNNALVADLNFDAAPMFIVASSKIVNASEKTTLPQYKYLGSENADKQLQHLIDTVKKAG